MEKGWEEYSGKSRMQGFHVIKTFLSRMEKLGADCEGTWQES